LIFFFCHVFSVADLAHITLNFLDDKSGVSSNQVGMTEFTALPPFYEKTPSMADEFRIARKHFVPALSLKLFA
jgi:hypothetical protein